MYGATDWGRTFTTIFLTILPTFILYFFLGKYMLAGMTDGAVKG
jgi:raffinose/stachyose/melibiose transport system permease protein